MTHRLRSIAGWLSVPATPWDLIDGHDPKVGGREKASVGFGTDLQ